MPIFRIKDTTRIKLTENIKVNKNLYVFNGIIFMVLGGIALASPLIAAEFLFILVGGLLLLTGLFQAVVSYAAKRHWSYYLSAVICISFGTLLILRPQAGILVLGTIIAIFLLLQGLTQLFYAGVYAPFRGWKWMLVTGLLSIALAILVFVNWPISTIWLLGVLVAINLILFGFSMLTIALNLGKSL